MTATAARPAGGSRAARLRGERGAAAVEFALVVPLLLLLFLGIVEFSQALQTQARLSAAAREGARVVALSGTEAQARAAVQAAVDNLDLPAAQITVTPSTCPATALTDTVTVTVTFTDPFAAGLLGQNGVELTGRAVMRCGG